MLKRSKIQLNKLSKLYKQSKKAITPQLLPQRIKQKFATYAPFLGAGIGVERVDLDNGLCITKLRCHRLNKGVYQGHFYGSLQMMVEPFALLMLIQKLGKNYYIVQQKSCIQFLCNTQDTAIARIKITTQDITKIIHECQNAKETMHTVEISITDSKQKSIAIVQQSFIIYPKGHSLYQTRTMHILE